MASGQSIACLRARFLFLLQIPSPVSTPTPPSSSPFYGCQSSRGIKLFRCTILAFSCSCLAKHHNFPHFPYPPISFTLPLPLLLLQMGQMALAVRFSLASHLAIARCMPHSPFYATFKVNIFRFFCLIRKNNTLKLSPLLFFFRFDFVCVLSQMICCST